MATKKEDKVIKKTAKESAKTATATKKDAVSTAKTEKVTARPTKKATEEAVVKQKAKTATSVSAEPSKEKRAQNATATKKTAPKTLQKQQVAVENTENENDTEVVIETVSSASQKPTYKKYHISQRNDTNMWQVKAEGADKALKLFKTQQEAIEYAKKVAESQDGSIMIHKKDGSFRKLNY